MLMFFLYITLLLSALVGILIYRSIYIQKGVPVRNVFSDKWLWNLFDCITVRFAEFAHKNNDAKIFRLIAGLGLFKGYMINDLGYVKEVMVTSRNNFVVQESTHEGIKSLMPNAILAFPTDTPQWQRYHTVMAKCFTDSYLDNVKVQMVECVNRLVAKWEKEIEESPTKSISRDLKHDIEDLSIDIIMAALMGVNYDELADQKRSDIREAICVFVQEIYRRMNPFSSKKNTEQVNKVMTVLRNAAQESIDKSAKADKNKDRRTMVSMLLEQQEHGDELFSDAAIQDALLILQFGAGETSTAGIIDTIRAFSSFKNVREEMRKELNITNADDSSLSVDEILNNTYVNNFAHELLRYYPVVGLTGRVAKDDHYFEDGSCIPKGSFVFIPFHKFHTDKNIWGENADKFEPNRWNNRQGAAADRFAFMPFGAGTRTCLGQRLAELELKLTAAILVNKFNFELDGEMKVNQKISVQPETVPMKVTLRKYDTISAPA